ncbi:MAG: hypothetical protein KGJ21_02005, partial [Pseudomonadota bacterium]|nr:hypothetical protein [Pseudomonadota bacterium]
MNISLNPVRAKRGTGSRAIETDAVLPLRDPRDKAITILGSTGSIGGNTLDIIAAHPQRFSVTALTAGDNVYLLAEQARRFKPKRAVIANEAHYDALKAALAGTG